MNGVGLVAEMEAACQPARMDLHLLRLMSLLLLPNSSLLTAETNSEPLNMESSWEETSQPHDGKLIIQGPSHPEKGCHSH